MSINTSPTTVSADRFDSLAALEAEHSLLVKELKSLLATPDGAERVLRFIRRAAATGAILDARVDRTAAQGLINFWTAKLAADTRDDEPQSVDRKGFSRVARPSFEDSLLAEFDPDTLRSVIAQANDHLGRRAEEDQRLAR